MHEVRGLKEKVKNYRRSVGEILTDDKSILEAVTLGTFHPTVTTAILSFEWFLIWGPTADFLWTPCSSEKGLSPWIWRSPDWPSRGVWLFRLTGNQSFEGGGNPDRSHQPEHRHRSDGGGPSWQSILHPRRRRVCDHGHFQRTTGRVTEEETWRWNVNSQKKIVCCIPFIFRNFLTFS